MASHKSKVGPVPQKGNSNLRNNQQADVDVASSSTPSSFQADQQQFSDDLADIRGMGGSQTSRQQIFEDATVTGKMMSGLNYVFNPQPENKIGRALQVLQIGLVALLAVCAVGVQVYTDAEATDKRFDVTDRISTAQIISTISYDVCELLAREMEIFYEFNDGPYELFLSRAQEAMRVLDTKLIWATHWPDENDLAVVSINLRENITSVVALRNALRLIRDTRKAINGTPESEVLNFYVTTITQLATVGTYSIISAPPFDGYQDLLAVTMMFQTFISFKLFSAVGRKLASENRTVMADNPVFGNMLLQYQSYVQYLSIATIYSDLADSKVQNLTSLDTAKEVDRLYQQALGMDFTLIDGVLFADTMIKHDANIQWLLGQLRESSTDQLKAFTNKWQTNDIFSVILYSISLFIIVAAFMLNLLGTNRQQLQIISYYDSLHQLRKALNLQYDYLPLGLINIARNSEVTPVTHYEDTCLMMVDVFNLDEMQSEMETQKFVDLLNDYCELFETTMRRYNCFKAEITGQYFLIGSGAGEHHAIDHVMELVLAGLDLQDSVSELNQFLAMEKNEKVVPEIRLRIALHVGACYSRVVYLQVAKVAILGEFVFTTALIHATSLASRTLVSGTIYNRLCHDANEIEFRFRGTIKLPTGSKDTLELYWVDWVDGTKQADDNSSTASGFRRYQP